MINRNKLAEMAFLISLVISGCSDKRNINISPESQQSPSNMSRINPSCRLKVGSFYPVKKEVDGDTFWLEDGCEGVKVRLIGIDAPESKNVFKKVKKEPFGDESTAFMSTLLKEQKIRIEYDIDTFDQHGRTLVYAYTESGIFLNKAMIDEGLAMISTFPPNVKYESLFYQAQKIARKEQNNIWLGRE